MAEPGHAGAYPFITEQRKIDEVGAMIAKP
jgi:hypothetical protein